MSLFEELQERKNKGEKLDLKILSPEELVQLWYTEDRLDREIAPLFDVEKEQVERRRMKFGITGSRCREDEIRRAHLGGPEAVREMFERWRSQPNSTNGRFLRMYEEKIAPLLETKARSDGEEE